MKTEQASELTRIKSALNDRTLSPIQSIDAANRLIENYLRTTEAAPSGGEGEPINLDGLLADAAIVESYAGTSGSEIAKGVAKNIRTAVAELRRLRTPTPPQSSPAVEYVNDVGRKNAALNLKMNAELSAVAPKESGAVAWIDWNGADETAFREAVIAYGYRSVFASREPTHEQLTWKTNAFEKVIYEMRKLNPSPPAAPLRAALLALARAWEAVSTPKVDDSDVTRLGCAAQLRKTLAAQQGDGNVL